MKLYKYLFAAMAGMLTLGFTGCTHSDSEFLEEHSYSYDDNGFYNTEEELQMGVNPCYREVQYLVQGQSHGMHSWMLMGLGLDTFGPTGSNTIFSNWNNLTPGESGGYIRHWYNELFYLVNYANTAIDMIDEKGDDITWSTSTARQELRAEAVFFRGWAYRCLAAMFGNVPIIDHHTTEIELGYVPNTRQEVWEFCYDDFDFARQNLPTTPRAIGCVTRAAADHMLAEVCLALGKFSEAEQAAGRVIGGSDGNYALMTSRFGSRADESVDRYGHSLAAPAGAYWDLFREDGNQDDASNTESIWVLQFAYGYYSYGGGGDSWWRVRANTTEANWLCGSIQRNTTTRTKSDGTVFYLWGDDAACYPAGVQGNSSTKSVIGTAAAAGRYVAEGQRDSIGANYGYAGTIAWPSTYTVYGLWNGTGDDIRGSETMIQRNWYGPGGKGWRQTYEEALARAKAAKGTADESAYSITGSDTCSIFPRFWKFSDDKHPDFATYGNKAYNAEWYMIRIAETYLLRAEARLAQGNSQGAADDINVLRNRAGGDNVSAGDVDIDLILDERTRELLGEEHRIVTLNRLSCNDNCGSYVTSVYPTQNYNTSNTLYERVRAYGFSYTNDSESTNLSRGRTWDAAEQRWIPNIKPYNYQYPIPTQVIQSNTGYAYPQNPGYASE